MSTSTFFNNFFRNFNSVDQPVKDHLTRVYATLTAATAFATLGAYIDVFTNLLPQAFGIFAALGSFLLIFLLYFTEHNAKNTPLRLGYLFGFSFAAGLSMGPLIEYSIRLNPSIVVSALFGSLFVFASFTLSALTSKPRSYLSLVGFLGTAIPLLIGLSVANIFFQSMLIFKVNLYLGLIMMSLFVLYDTSLIMEKRRMGDTDFILHSLDLFIDFIGIFRRLLILLSQNEENSRRRRRSSN